MNDHELEKISIAIDEENPDAQFQEDVDEPQAVKLNKRITRASFLIITLMAVVILFAYIDLKKNLSTMSSSGNSEIQTLSQDMQSKFSSLLLQQAKFEEVLAKKITPLEKSVGSMQTNLKAISTTITQIRSARSSDNKKTAEAIEAIHKTLTPIPKNLETLISDVDRFKQKYSNELAALSRTVTTIQQQLKMLQSDMEVLSSSQLDKKKLDIELSNERTIYQKRLAQFQSDLENRLLSIEKKIEELKKINASFQEHMSVKTKEAQPIESQKSNPVDDNTQPQPGAIIEQDIQYHGQGDTSSDPK